MKKTLLLLFSLLIVCSVSAKKKVDPSFATTVYMYGISASFNDSTVYITDVQVVDSAFVENKRFLGGLKRYVTQMDNYFKAKGEPRRTNTVFFKMNRKDAEKDFVRLRKRYSGDDVKMKVLPVGEFTFTTVRPYETENEYAGMTKTEVKAAKKQKKADSKKEHKQAVAEAKKAKAEAKKAESERKAAKKKAEAEQKFAKKQAEADQKFARKQAEAEKKNAKK